VAERPRYHARMRSLVGSVVALAAAAGLSLAPAAAAQEPGSRRFAAAAGETAFALWRVLDLLSFRILEPLSRIIDARDAGDVRYLGPKGAKQFRSDFLAIVLLGPRWLFLGPRWLSLAQPPPPRTSSANTSPNRRSTLNATSVAATVASPRTMAGSDTPRGGRHMRS